MTKATPLRKRWLLNLAGVLGALGMVCVVLLTALFTAHMYSDLEQQLCCRAEEASDFFFRNSGNDLGQYVLSCAAFAEERSASGVAVQWIRNGDESVARFPDVQEAITSRGIVPAVTRDPQTNLRVMSVSCPMIFSDGEVAGVLRYSQSISSVRGRIEAVAFTSVGVLLAVLVIVLLASNVFIGSVLDPLRQINDTAKTIAAGSYGVQIRTKYSDEIGNLADTVNDLSSKISQNEKMQAEFISSLSHELRTPLTVINGWSETLLADDAMDPDTQRGLKIISGEAKRLTEMVMELLDFTRLHDGQMTLMIEPSDVLATFEDTVYMYRSRLKQEGIDLHYDVCEEDIPDIPCDTKRLRQVFLNILDNAAKHGGDGKKIDAAIHYDNNAVVVQIRDYGPGIPEDELPLVKKKFYKGTSKARGTGIGLAVSDEIVTMHGGTLTLENAEGGGALVTVRLPDAN